MRTTRDKRAGVSSCGWGRLRNERERADAPLHDPPLDGRPCLGLCVPREQHVHPRNAPSRPRDGPRTLCAGKQIPDPLSREVADSILSRPPGGSRPAPVESLNLNPLSSPHGSCAGPPSKRHAAPGRWGAHPGAMSASAPLRNEQKRGAAGGPLSGPSAASNALHRGVSPYPGVCSRCIPVWDRPPSHSPGRV
jgi:hypothetical protein